MYPSQNRLDNNYLTQVCMESLYGSNLDQWGESCRHVKTNMLRRQRKNTSANPKRWKSERGEGLDLMPCPPAPPQPPHTHIAKLQLENTHCPSQTQEKRCYASAKVTRNSSRYSPASTGNLMEATGLYLRSAGGLHVMLRNAEAQS